MVKTVNLTLEDSIHEQLNKAKGDKTWFDFLIVPKLDKKQQRTYLAEETD